MPRTPSSRLRSLMLASKVDSTAPMKLYLKLRGSTLSAHLAPRGESLFQSTVKSLLSTDDAALRIFVKLSGGRGVTDGDMNNLGGSLVLLEASDGMDYNRWKCAFQEASSTSFEMHYKKLRRIGKGHFSDVFLAQDRTSGEKVAVKVIKKDATDLDKSRKFIRREVKVLSLTDHENLVRAIDFFSQDNRPHIVMEYLPHGTLKELIDRHTSLAEPPARQIFQGILRGVAYLHSLRIVHRDMKPENILMVSPTHPKITDFGLSTFINKEDDKIHSLVGTPSYVSPELCAGIPYGTAADMWSCGVMLFYMLSGLRPFRGDTKEEVKREILTAAVKFPEAAFRRVGMNAKRLVLRMLDRDQKSRISAEDALNHPWLSSTWSFPDPKFNAHLLLIVKHNVIDTVNDPILDS